MSAYVVIPARGGSKGIPRKNLQIVGGQPLVTRCITAALTAGHVDLVVVTTDDSEIADVARRAGARVVERPAELSGDTATSESAVVHALDALRAQGDDDPDVTVLAQCTSPFSRPEDFDATIDAVADGADCAFTGARTHAFLWRAGDDGAQAVNHESATRARRQERPVEFVETGAVYAMRTSGLRSVGHRFFGRIEVVEVPGDRALEIDEPADLERARLLAPSMGGSDPSMALPGHIAGLALDFDGVLTDNTVVTTQDGTEAVVSDRSDGLGLGQLRATGLPMVVLSKERNPVVAARCEKLAVECVQGVDDKRGAFAAWMDDQGLDPAAVIFVGNDTNDVECLTLAGCGVVVADAHPAARAAADLVLTRPGGHGAVRELADLLLERMRSV